MAQYLHLPNYVTQTKQRDLTLCNVGGDHGEGLKIGAIYS